MPSPAWLRRGIGAEAIARRCLERFHGLFLHPHVDVGRGHLEVLFGRFGRCVMRAVVAQALPHVLNRKRRIRGRRNRRLPPPHIVKSLFKSLRSTEAPPARPARTG